MCSKIGNGASLPSWLLWMSTELYKGMAASMGKANAVEGIIREKLADEPTEAEVENRREAD